MYIISGAVIAMGIGFLLGTFLGTIGAVLAFPVGLAIGIFCTRKQLNV